MTWNGEERRIGRCAEHKIELDVLNKKMETIIDNQTNFKSYFEMLFGAKDLAGNPVEGKITGQLREMTEKIKIQNGRIGRLERDRLLVIGGCVVVMFIMKVFLKV